MQIRKLLLTLVTTLAIALQISSSLKSAIGDDAATDIKVDAKNEKPKETGTIIGRIEVPTEIPDWFNGGELLLADAVVVIEGMYKGPRFKRPDNFREMSSEQRSAWAEEYKKTEAYQEFERKSREAYENRPLWKFPVAADGTFVADGLKLGRYNVIPVIPHKAAKGKELASQSWGTAFRQIVLTEKRKSFNVGKMKLKLNNVVMPGDVAPAWTGNDYDDGQTKSSDFRGKFLVIDFWATWCGPCIVEMPNMEKVYDELGGDRLAMVGLSIDDSIDLPIEFLDKRPTTYTQVFLGPGGGDDDIMQSFGIQSVPSIWLIGPDGRVIARDLAGEKIGIAVRSALGEPSAVRQ